MFTTLSTVRKHINIDDDFHDDDQYLLELIEVAENIVAKQINRPLPACVGQDGLLPATIRHSILIVVANLYSQRESIAPIQMHKVPHTLEWLMSTDRRYIQPR